MWHYTVCKNVTKKAKLEVIPFGSDNVFGTVSSVISLNFFLSMYLQCKYLEKKVKEKKKGKSHECCLLSKKEFAKVLSRYAKKISLHNCIAFSSLKQTEILFKMSMQPQPIKTIQLSRVILQGKDQNTNKAFPPKLFLDYVERSTFKRKQRNLGVTIN